jgi:outer membrane protein OmpA-like peptidoglycan-associated protein
MLLEVPMKKLAVITAHVFFGLFVLSTQACSSTQAKQQTGTAARVAHVSHEAVLTTPSPLYFEFDSEELTEGSLQSLRRLAMIMHKVPKTRVVVSGHTDERGDEAYNLALGERRGWAAKQYLLALGVPKQRVRVLSYGEEVPAMPGTDETSWELNRRDEFTLYIPSSSVAEAEDAALRLDARTRFDG